MIAAVANRRRQLKIAGDQLALASAKDRAGRQPMHSVCDGCCRLSCSLFTAAGCALPDWEPPQEPYVDLQGSSDDYTQSQWTRKQSR